MSRHGINEGDGGWDEYDDLRMWAYTNALERATNGKRGQKLLRDLGEALDALPQKRLVRAAFERTTGDVCALGALGRARGVDMTELQHRAAAAERDWDSGDGGEDYGVPHLAAETFDVAKSLAAEVMYINDDKSEHEETPEERWKRVRRWVYNSLKPPVLEGT